MENATKALLIAASILIVILLIGFGMMMFKSTDSSASDADEVGKTVNIEIKKATLKLKGKKLGDVDGNGRIGNGDINFLERYIDGKLEDDELDLDVADLNFDGKYNNEDVEILKQMLT